MKKKYMIYSNKNAVLQKEGNPLITEALNDGEALYTFYPNNKILNHFDMMVCVEESEDPYEMDPLKIVSFRVVAIFAVFNKDGKRQVNHLMLSDSKYNTSYPFKEIGYVKFGIKNCGVQQCFGAKKRDEAFSIFIKNNPIDKGDIVISFKPDKSFTMINNRLVGIFLEVDNNNKKFSFIQPNATIPIIKFN